MPEILVIKIVVTMIVVVGLSLLAEHVSARLAGILAGYPHGIAIVIYFLGLEQGVVFAAQASVYAIAGLAANVLMVYGYYLLCRTRHKKNLILATGGSIGVFLLTSLMLRQFEFNQFIAATISVAMIMLVAVLLRKVDNIRVSAGIKTSLADLISRAFISALIVLAVTETAHLIGPDWSGLLAGFPVVTFPLLIIIHYRHGSKPLATIVKNYPYGLIGLVIYTATVSYVYPILGLNLGTLAGFILATIYLVSLSYLARKTRIRTNQQDSLDP